MDTRQLLAIVWAVHSAMVGLLGLVVALWFGAFGVLATVLPDSHSGEPLPPIAGWIIGGCGVFGGGVMLFALLPGAVAAVGLWRNTQWGRIAALVAAILSLFSGFPWLLLGVGTLVWLWRDHEAAKAPPAEA